MPVPANDIMIASLFTEVFAAERLQMFGGGVEPRYTAARGDVPATLQYTADFASSALHEAAHWCLAGADRRALDDFGYFYVPAEARSGADQRRFEAAEVRTQAIEWLFSLAAGVEFHLSVDSIGRDVAMFRGAVVQEVQRRIATRLPARAMKFRVALAWRFCGEVAPSPALVHRDARRA